MKRWVQSRCHHCRGQQRVYETQEAQWEAAAVTCALPPCSPMPGRSTRAPEAIQTRSWEAIAREGCLEETTPEWVLKNRLSQGKKETFPMRNGVQGPVGESLVFMEFEWWERGQGRRTLQRPASGRPWRLSCYTSNNRKCFSSAYYGQAHFWALPKY